MGLVKVTGAKLGDGGIESLRVLIHRLPSRIIDRDTAIAWLRDGHSLLVDRIGKPLVALQLVEVEVDGEPKPFIRSDNAKDPSDALPELPAP